MSFGERLKSARKDRGMTLRELGEAIDHPEAATDEYYFDDREIVEKIIAEN